MYDKMAKMRKIFEKNYLILLVNICSLEVMLVFFLTKPFAIEDEVVALK